MLSSTRRPVRYLLRSPNMACARWLPPQGWLAAWPDQGDPSLATPYTTQVLADTEQVAEGTTVPFSASMILSMVTCGWITALCHDG
jgi:hypothetical protein